jgi:hypothetical protein
LIFFSAWTIGGIIALFGALTYAEIGQRLPVMGGYYKVFAHCYHPAATDSGARTVTFRNTYFDSTVK